VSLRTRYGRVSRWFSCGRNRARSCRTRFAGSRSPLHRSSLALLSPLKVGRPLGLTVPPASLVPRSAVPPEGSVWTGDIGNGCTGTWVTLDT
jgi:hypothetical protein